MTAEAPLVPCPFCGDRMNSFGGMVPDAFARSSDGAFAVNCHCGATGPLVQTMEAATAAWNRRPLPAGGSHSEREALAIALMYLEGQNPLHVSGGQKNFELRDRIRTALSQPAASVEDALWKALVPDPEEPVSPLSWLRSLLSDARDRGPVEGDDDPDSYWIMVEEVQRLHDRCSAVLSTPATADAIIAAIKGGAP